LLAISVLLPGSKAIPKGGPLQWLFAEFGGSCCEEEASAQQIEFGAAVHAALQELEAVDLSLSLAAAPRQTQGGAHGTAILIEIGREALHNPHAAVARLSKPRLKRHDGRTIRPLRGAAGTDDPAEPPAEINDRRGLRVLHHPLDHGDVLWAQLCRFAKQVP
jgi:hypothetical protein